MESCVSFCYSTFWMLVCVSRMRPSTLVISSNVSFKRRVILSDILSKFGESKSRLSCCCSRCLCLLWSCLNCFCRLVNLSVSLETSISLFMRPFTASAKSGVLTSDTINLPFCRTIFLMPSSFSFFATLFAPRVVFTNKSKIILTTFASFSSSFCSSRISLPYFLIISAIKPAQRMNFSFFCNSLFMVCSSNRRFKEHTPLNLSCY